MEGRYTLGYYDKHHLGLRSLFTMAGLPKVMATFTFPKTGVQVGATFLTQCKRELDRLWYELARLSWVRLLWGRIEFSDDVPHLHVLIWPKRVTQWERDPPFVWVSRRNRIQYAHVNDPTRQEWRPEDVDVGHNHVLHPSELVDRFVTTDLIELVPGTSEHHDQIPIVAGVRWRYRQHVSRTLSDRGLSAYLTKSQPLSFAAMFWELSNFPIFRSQRIRFFTPLFTLTSNPLEHRSQLRIGLQSTQRTIHRSDPYAIFVPRVRLCNFDRMWNTSLSTLKLLIAPEDAHVLGRPFDAYPEAVASRILGEASQFMGGEMMCLSGKRQGQRQLAPDYLRGFVELGRLKEHLRQLPDRVHTIIRHPDPDGFSVALLMSTIIRYLRETSSVAAYSDTTAACYGNYATVLHDFAFTRHTEVAENVVIALTGAFNQNEGFWTNLQRSIPKTARVTVLTWRGCRTKETMRLVKPKGEWQKFVMSLEECYALHDSLQVPPPLGLQTSDAHVISISPIYWQQKYEHAGSLYDLPWWLCQKLVLHVGMKVMLTENISPMDGLAVGSYATIRGWITRDRCAERNVYAKCPWNLVTEICHLDIEIHATNEVLELRRSHRRGMAQFPIVTSDSDIRRIFREPDAPACSQP